MRAVRRVWAPGSDSPGGLGWAASEVTSEGPGGTRGSLWGSGDSGPEGGLLFMVPWSGKKALVTVPPCFAPPQGCGGVPSSPALLPSLALEPESTWPGVGERKWPVQRGSASRPREQQQ